MQATLKALAQFNYQANHTLLPRISNKRPMKPAIM
jgi:hypothetical protein